MEQELKGEEMANQSVAKPRFYLDFTQLAKAKGYIWSENLEDLGTNLEDNNDPKNSNVWDFDYTKTTNYTAVTSASGYFTFKMTPFWTTVWDQVEDNLNLEWCKLMGTANFAGVINHNLNTRAVESNNVEFFMHIYWHSGISNTTMGTIDNIVNSRGITSDGYSFCEWTPDNQYPVTEPHRYSQFNLQFSGGSVGDDMNFDIGAITFGKYIDMPHSPDLSVKKSVEYDGVKIKRSLGGSDLVQINHQGQPDWLVGEPWTRKDYASNGRVGRNGRRSWDLNFSYISNDDLFYDLNERVVGGSADSDGDTEQFFDSTSEIQQIWDLTLGGALSFVFCPDKDATNLEFAVCRLDQDSLVATQVAYQTWNISMSVVEVW